MQAAHDMIASASTSLFGQARSLRQFSRIGALALGVVVGVATGANELSRRETSFKSSIASRDAKIAELMTANEALSPSKDIEKSSGDDVQDWVDSLGK